MKATFYGRRSRDDLGLNIIDERTRYLEDGDDSPMTDYDQTERKPIDFFEVAHTCANPDCTNNQESLEVVPVNILGLCSRCAANFRMEVLDEVPTDDEDEEKDDLAAIDA
jgi:hypothetical protein